VRRFKGEENDEERNPVVDKKSETSSYNYGT